MYRQNILRDSEYSLSFRYVYLHTEV